MNSFSFFPAGLTLFLCELAIVLGSVYPRWVGLVAAVSGTAFMYDGTVVVSYEGFIPSIIKLVGLVVLAVWAFVMTFLMWRNGGRGRIARPKSTLWSRDSNPSVHTWYPSGCCEIERSPVGPALLAPPLALLALIQRSTWKEDSPKLDYLR